MKPVPLPPRKRPVPVFHPKTLDRQFAADPFDPRMHRDSPHREHTALGLLVEIWQWYRTHEADCGPAFRPIAGSIRELLQREAPEHVEFLETMQ
jgi:hypothetical protein